MLLMFKNASDLLPSTKWSETIWSSPVRKTLIDSRSSSRLCVAALLPFKDGQPDWGSFERMLVWMHECANFFEVEITFVLNVIRDMFLIFRTNFTKKGFDGFGACTRCSFYKWYNCCRCVMPIISKHLVIIRIWK